MKIKVFGPGCLNCTKTEKVVRDVVARLGIDADIEKVTDMMAIVDAGVLGTPAVSIDGEMKIAGKVPREDEIEAWFNK